MNSLLDSIHGSSGHEGMIPLDQQYQLFASAGAIIFPTPESEAWKEKVNKEIQSVSLTKYFNLILIKVYNCFLHR